MAINNHSEEEMKMLADFFGTKVVIPKGYHIDSNGNYINNHGVEYQLVEYGRGKDSVICLETIYSKHVRTIELKKA